MKCYQVGEFTKAPQLIAVIFRAELIVHAWNEFPLLYEQILPGPVQLAFPGPKHVNKLLLASNNVWRPLAREQSTLPLNNPADLFCYWGSL